MSQAKKICLAHTRTYDYFIEKTLIWNYIAFISIEIDDDDNLFEKFERDNSFQSS